MKGIGTKTIETERLILRRMEVSDVEYIYRNWTSDDLVTRHLSWPTHKSVEDTKEYVNRITQNYDNNPYYFDWVVVLKEINEPIGQISAVMVSVVNDIVEMGDCYGSKYWNKGYGTEALKAFIDYMFNEANVGKIIAFHHVNNPASGRIMVKAGMHYDATLPLYLVDKCSGKRVDKVCYSIDRKG